MNKKAKLDDATVAVLQKVLAMPPKPHEAMKVGRLNKKRVTRKSTKPAKPGRGNAV